MKYRLYLFFCCFLCALGLTAFAQRADLGSFKTVEFSQLSDSTLGALGQQALLIRTSEWHHAESEHFVYHFFHDFVAAPVSSEAEFYYGIVSKELQKDTTQWEHKCHIYIFEKPEDWAAFQKRGALDPWTGGLHAGGELFIQRNPEVKWKGNSLGHEVTHLVIYRFFGNGVPLWINEGYAEYSASRGYAAYNRARGFLSTPRARASDPAQYFPLAQLTSAVTYPQDVLQVPIFYAQSERLVRFLSAADKAGFLTFLESLAHGSRIETALGRAYGSKFSSLDTLQREFMIFATKDVTAPASN